MAESTEKAVIIRDCAVSEIDGEQIVRGVIDVSSFPSLRDDEYQREALPVTTVEEWEKAFAIGDVPDIDLGMRGSDFDVLGNGSIRLNNPVYIVDGLQRVTAARHLIKNSDKRPYLGATIRFKTTEDSERARFHRLNTKRIKLSTNVILANMRHDVPVVAALFGVTAAESGSVLSGRVTWTQRAARTDLFSSVTLLKVVGEIHAHLGSTRRHEVDALALAMQAVTDEIGIEQVMANVAYFIDMVDELWELGKIEYRGRSVPNQNSFLVGLARALSDHTDFWQGPNKLFVRQPERQKLGKYPVGDPSVKNIVAAGRDSVYRDLVSHINSGRRHGHLRRRGSAD